MRSVSALLKGPTCNLRCWGDAVCNLYYFVRLCKGNARNAEIVWVRRGSLGGSLCEHYSEQGFLKPLAFVRLCPGGEIHTISEGLTFPMSRTDDIVWMTLLDWAWSGLDWTRGGLGLDMGWPRLR